MTMNAVGRPTAPVPTEASVAATFTGNRGLAVEEPLLFEVGRPDVSGVDFDDVEFRSFHFIYGLRTLSVRWAQGR